MFVHFTVTLGYLTIDGNILLIDMDIDMDTFLILICITDLIDLIKSEMVTK